jgi:hypothetical protein
MAAAHFQRLERGRRREGGDASRLGFGGALGDQRRDDLGRGLRH